MDRSVHVAVCFVQCGGGAKKRQQARLNLQQERLEKTKKKEKEKEINGSSRRRIAELTA